MEILVPIGLRLFPALEMYAMRTELCGMRGKAWSAGIYGGHNRCATRLTLGSDWGNGRQGRLSPSRWSLATPSTKSKAKIQDKESNTIHTKYIGRKCNELQSHRHSAPTASKLLLGLGTKLPPLQLQATEQAKSDRGETTTYVVVGFASKLFHSSSTPNTNANGPRTSTLLISQTGYKSSPNQATTASMRSLSSTEHPPPRKRSSSGGRESPSFRPASSLTKLITTIHLAPYLPH
ncbi:hypothetical protein ACFX15_002128 [Malus domestica]